MVIASPLVKGDTHWGRPTSDEEVPAGWCHTRRGSRAQRSPYGSAEAPQVVATNHLSVNAPVTGFAAVNDAIVIRAGNELIRVGQAKD